MGWAGGSVLQPWRLLGGGRGGGEGAGGGGGGGGGTAGQQQGQGGRQQGQQGQGQPLPAPVPKFRGSRALDKVVRPLDRWAGESTSACGAAVVGVACRALNDAVAQAPTGCGWAVGVGGSPRDGMWPRKGVRAVGARWYGRWTGGREMRWVGGLV